eukprot:EG_transcript_37463
MQAVVLPSAGQQAALIPKMKEWQCMFLAGSVRGAGCSIGGPADVLVGSFVPPKPRPHSSALLLNALELTQHLAADPRPRVIHVPAVRPDRKAARYLSLPQLQRQRQQMRTFRPWPDRPHAAPGPATGVPPVPWLGPPLGPAVPQGRSAQPHGAGRSAANRRPPP